MSYEIFKQIHGMSHFVGRHNSSSIMKQIVIGYGVPLLVVLVTVIVELTAPRCSSYSPRFGHKSCLFFGKLDKFLWLYLPILVMLIINTLMFIYITINVVQNQKTAPSDSMKSGNRKEKLDKICLYLRLFLGMGVIWYFELISFATSTETGNDEWAYFTDCLNMLQVQRDKVLLSFLFYPGCLGIYHLCLQEKCYQDHHQEVRQTLQWYHQNKVKSEPQPRTNQF